MEKPFSELAPGEISDQVEKYMGATSRRLWYYDLNPGTLCYEYFS